MAGDGVRLQTGGYPGLAGDGVRLQSAAGDGVHARCGVGGVTVGVGDIWRLALVVVMFEARWFKSWTLVWVLVMLDACKYRDTSDKHSEYPAL